ncbi:GPI transamidase component PIG-S isoform X2 [Asparagus officinalis]|uniref:GPI transamidase component PIG-S isoform X2 n=1 Tax=Asparagus officinalis TaxID=4686 RepID=UPI00098DE3D7|nr:GPI transamidase component PIG-S isoform X2 [Asparagus officinalis]
MAIEEEVPPPKPPSSPSSIDGSSQRKTKPGTKRLFLTLSVLLSFLSGIPFLLKSTEIHRSPLPFAGAISSRQNLSFPCRFHAVFLPSSSSSFSPPQALARSLLQSTSSSSTCSSVTISVTVDSPGGCESTEDGIWKCGARNGIEFSGDVDDDAVDELLDLRIGAAARIYTVVVAVKEEEVRVVVGKHRHAWIVGRVSEEAAVEMVSEIFAKMFMRGGREENKEEEDFMPVGLDGNLVLSLSLLNAGPNDWVYDWEMQKVEKLILAPVVEALAPIANIRTESQVLYHTPKSSISSWDDNLSSYVFSTRDLPFFVNSNEWHLDTSVAVTGRSKVLQFVVYVPSVDECPLLLRLPNGDTSKTNGFISPMWGGVVVWNPPNCSRNSLLTQLTRNMISPEEMQKIFQVFVGQLRLLFGFKSDYSHVVGGRKFNFLPSVRGFTEWELDVLYRHHACSNLISCTSTLESLSKLVQSLPRMIVKDEIGKQSSLARHMLKNSYVFVLISFCNGTYHVVVCK